MAIFVVITDDERVVDQCAHKFNYFGDFHEAFEFYEKARDGGEFDYVGFFNVIMESE